MDTVTVNASALHAVLTALIGAPHEICELQALRSSTMFGDNNPINILITD